MKNVFFLFMCLSTVLFNTMCYDATHGENNEQDPAYEDSGIIVEEDALIDYTTTYHSDKLRWGGKAHQYYAYICAKKFGLSEARAVIMKNASTMADEFQSGIDNFYNQQWSHAYIYNSKGSWIWGDADDDYHDNINGDSGEIESPEGYNSKWAGYYYQKNNRDLGDWYVGYASHYIADVSFVLHTTFPDLNMAIYHSNYEKWINNNWADGHKFSEVANSIPTSSYYTITSLKQALRTAAKNSNYYANTNAKNAWNYYKASGYPVSAGSGSSEAVIYTKKMVVEATKWSGGTIKYALDKYSAW